MGKEMAAFVLVATLRNHGNRDSVKSLLSIKQQNVICSGYCIGRFVLRQSDDGACSFVR
jgi:hypothetical protein